MAIQVKVSTQYGTNEKGELQPGWSLNVSGG